MSVLLVLHSDGTLGVAGRWHKAKTCTKHLGGGAKKEKNRKGQAQEQEEEEAEACGAEKKNDTNKTKSSELLLVHNRQPPFSLSLHHLTSLCEFLKEKGNKTGVQLWLAVP